MVLQTRKHLKQSISLRSTSSIAHSICFYIPNRGTTTSIWIDASLTLKSPFDIAISFFPDLLCNCSLYLFSTTQTFSFYKYCHKSSYSLPVRCSVHTTSCYRTTLLSLLFSLICALTTTPSFYPPVHNQDFTGLTQVTLYSVLASRWIWRNCQFHSAFTLSETSGIEFPSPYQPFPNLSFTTPTPQLSFLKHQAKISRQLYCIFLHSTGSFFTYHTQPLYLLRLPTAIYFHPNPTLSLLLHSVFLLSTFYTFRYNFIVQ